MCGVTTREGTEAGNLASQDSPLSEDYVDHDSEDSVGGYALRRIMTSTLSEYEDSLTLPSPSK
jgi:hypothetical protein